MSESVLESLSRNPSGDVAIVDPAGADLTFGQLLSGAHHMAGQLASLGVGRDSTVASVLPNGPAAAQLYLGALAAGRSAPLNPKLTARELVEQLASLEARVLVTTPERVAELGALEIDVPVVAVTASDDGFELTDGGRQVPWGDADTVSGDSDALVLLTSGTTGAPKRVSLKHGNLLHAVKGIVSTLSLDPSDRGLLLMPMFHIHGLQAALLAPLVAGGRVVIPSAFDAFAVPGLCESNRVTWYTAVPAMHSLVVDRATRRDRSWAESVRFTRCSSAPMPSALYTEVEKVLGAPLIEAYGMTECAHQIASNPLNPGLRKPGTVGVPTGVEIRIAEVEGTNRGEVLVRGTSVTNAYEAVDPDVNRRAFEGGWFHTGDEGELDPEGYLTLTGRLKEIINRGGEKIRPKEVEEVLARHPGVKEVAVFAVPHPRLGEDVAAVVVPLDTTLTAQELRRFARNDLAAFKVPRTVHIAELIPRGPTGKVQRSKLAEQLDIA